VHWCSSQGKIHICQPSSSASMPARRVGAGVNQDDCAGLTIELAAKVAFLCLSEMQTFYEPFSLKELGLDFKAAEQNTLIQAKSMETKSMDNDTKGFNVHEIFSDNCSILSVLSVLFPEKASDPSGSGRCISWHDSIMCPLPHRWYCIPTRKIQYTSFTSLIKERITRY